LIQTAKAMPANHATAITAYLIFFLVGIAVISGTVLLLLSL
jgi:hypothetical protein